MSFKARVLFLLALPLIVMGNSEPCCCLLEFTVGCQEEGATHETGCAHDHHGRHAALEKDDSSAGTSGLPRDSGRCECPAHSEGVPPCATAATRAFDDAAIAQGGPIKPPGSAFALGANQVWLWDSLAYGRAGPLLFIRYLSLRV